MYDSYYDTKTILDKISLARTSGTDGGVVTQSSELDENSQLASLMPNSFAEIWASYQDVLTLGEAEYLSQAISDAQKKNTETEVRTFSRANPQLAQAVSLGISQNRNTRDYTSAFGNRAQMYVSPGSVASMFSPAGYLTELYREARDLHTTGHARHLDSRRPDLAHLALSQDNMDAEVTTLSIANDIVLNAIASQEGTDGDAVMEKLAAWRFSGNTPYHLPYESARLAVLLQDPMLNALTDSPAIAQQVDLNSLLAIVADVSPELFRILTEEISTGSAADLYSKNFGTITTDTLMNTYMLAGYYDVSAEDLTALTSLLTHHDFSEPVPYYVNNILTSLVSASGPSAGGVVQIVRSAQHSTLNYAELLPQGGDSYLFNFNFNSAWSAADVLRIGTQSGNSSDLYQGALIPQANEHISIPVTIPAEKLAAGVSIGITRYDNDSSSYKYAPTTFQLYTLSSEQYLLYLNKIIRLYKACRLTAEQMYLLIYNHPGTEPFATGMLGLSFLSYYYLQRYSLRFEDALVLAGGRISAVGVKGQDSYFTTLFNTPPLSNRSFSADGAPVDWDSQDADHLFRASVIKRGFHTSGADLKVLWQIAAGESTAFTATADNLALLYRTQLLAEVHHLSASELALLLAVSPWQDVPLSSLDTAGFAAAVNFVYSTTRWLKQLDWTVGDLYLMTTTDYSPVLTPEISSLVASLRGAVGQADADTPALIRDIAPVIAAAGQLNQSGRAESILRWLDVRKPGGTDVKTFIALVLKDTRSEAETGQLVAFCQALAQLALLVRKTDISDYLLSMLISDPSRFAGGVSVIPLDIESLRLLGRMNRRILQTGDYAQQVLAALEAGTLTTALLAQALGATPQSVEQALADSGAGGIIRSLKTLDVTLQWLDFSAALNCTPSTAAAVVALKYTNISADNSPSYDDWLAVSNLLQAGLSAEHTVTLHHQLDELTSAALSSYYIQTAGQSEVNNREQLYAWLLIDGQVSSQVTTTRVAEAIASIQLYVNRCQNGLETEVQLAVLTRQFFTDWDRYNKRYSTWAGVSELVYYPENYIDPTVRTGQTSMMDNLLGTIGQSELSADSVGDAFRGYMTQFEKVANLEIVSAYHDNASIEEGKTWFIGKSMAEGEKYYWRTLQQSMLTDGKYPATAWSEWLEIGTGIAAYNNMVHPVVFNDRLYVVWVTERPIAKNNSGTVTQASDYFLSFSYRLLERDTLNEAKMWYVQALHLLGEEPYDSLVYGQGNWASPVLGAAASQTLHQAYQLQLLRARAETVPAVETRTANSLLGLFYPQFNGKLSGYWQTLRQRLYNLRHNLSIDGQALYLPVYAAPISPSALLSAAVMSASGGDSLPAVPLPLLRFPTLLESARGVVSQLIQFGNAMQAITERQDAEALSVLLQNQGLALLSQSIQVQEHALTELDADREALLVSRAAAEQRRNSYRQLYDENINAGEIQAMSLQLSSSVTAQGANALHMGAAALSMVPNIYGLANGGGRYGAILSAVGIGIQIASDVQRIASDKVSQSEYYRRRRQEWEIQRNNAESEIKLADAQLASLSVRREGLALQKAQVETQLAQTQAQLDYLKGKFTGQALYSWLRGTLSSIYYQFYDAALTRCLLAQRAWQLHFADEATTFIKPGAWRGSWLGFMAGETLMLELERMSQAWIEQDARMLEVNKTVSLADFYSGGAGGSFILTDQAPSLIINGSGSVGSGGNTLSIADGQLKASVRLADLSILDDYPAGLGARRRIKQISVTLALPVGPYEDVQAVLSYGGSVVLPQGCKAVVVSHGMNDSGQFQLDFNDGRWLPFEGIPVDDSGTLTLSFPDINGEQKELLLGLADIVLHIRYTITG